MWVFDSVILPHNETLKYEERKNSNVPFDEGKKNFTLTQ